MQPPICNPQFAMANLQSPRRGGALLWTLSMLLALSVTLAAATTTFYQLARLSRRNRERLIAAQIGQRELERLRAGAFHGMGQWYSGVSALPDGTSAVTITD